MSARLKLLISKKSVFERNIRYSNNVSIEVIKEIKSSPGNVSDNNNNGLTNFAELRFQTCHNKMN